MSGVPEAKTYVYTPAPGGSEAQNGLPDSILSSEPKPLVQHKPPPPQSIWNIIPMVNSSGMYRGGGSGGDGNAVVTASISARVEAILSVWIWVGHPDNGSNGDGVGGGDGHADGAVHLARRSPAEGDDSKASGNGGGVGMARSLSTYASGRRDMEA
nr:hypothetical protein [Tanacetum cinerariifolium]